MAEDARERILDACARVISRSGLRRFRMSDVAGEAGVSIGLLAYHFGDRDGLLAAALDHVTAGTNARAAGAAAADAGAASSTRPDRPAAQRLESLLCSEFGDEPGVREGSTAWNEVRAAAVFEAAQAAAVARSTADWQRQVEELLEEAGVPNTDARELARILTALVEGLSGRWLTGQLTTADAQDSIRITLRLLGFGAGADALG
ncbi:TetR/AcrR family transcriptional regulator [Leucobacter sp. CSA2]|uniref:TetR/AcrR family transcriptional regulator n=1 Tax=Leucobacter edaphi TaxID=2796472 RepID=A0A934UYG5_9MICO|nr:TetR/AcrR family transcriptional regulator [Leucobacter edaphi]MBK0422523.1 TetR/AcrR family transcriptional regulator [Leucobacter edaphi]